METLFVPAFENTTYLKLQEKRLTVFFKYKKKASSYYGEDYCDDLLKQIKNVASPELLILILQKK